MMTGDEILSFIITGEWQGIRVGMTIDEVNGKLGRPDDVIGDSQVGYLMYGIFRIGYRGNIIDEMALFFYKDPDVCICLDYKDDEEYFEISAHAKINEVIRLMNYRGISWNCYDKSNSDYFTIRSESKVAIVFDLYDGSLFMISYLQDAV
jgi:hypothetical protein